MNKHFIKLWIKLLESNKYKIQLRYPDIKRDGYFSVYGVLLEYLKKTKNMDLCWDGVNNEGICKSGKSLTYLGCPKFLTEFLGIDRSFPSIVKNKASFIEDLKKELKKYE